MPGGKCVYSKKVQDEYPWIKENYNDKHSVICSICSSSITIGKAIKSNLERHLKTSRHEERVKEIQEKSDKATIQGMKGVETYFKPTNSKSQELVLKAETYHVIKLISENSSFYSSNCESTSNQTASLQFPDSQIAKSMKVGKTKASYDGSKIHRF